MYRNILLPVALDHGKDASQALDIARRLGGDAGKITFVHVIERIPSYAIGQIPEGAIEQVRSEATKQIARLAQEAGDAAEWELLDGSPGPAIVEYANDKSIDCIVLSSHKPGLSDYLLGSTAARVVRHARCPVHVIR